MKTYLRGTRYSNKTHSTEAGPSLQTPGQNSALGALPTQLPTGIKM